MLKKLVPALCWALVIALAGLFFTNDFGLVDIHKTSLVVAVGVDAGQSEVKVTAQVAVPQPSASGDNVQYVQVQGSGYTVADALNEINVKTGTYPKLLFCKLILLGDGCRDKELFQVLGCFYRRNYSELTAQVAMCEGKAEDMLALPATIAPENSTAIQKVLSAELERSANVSSANLKSIAQSNYSVSEACFMPYIQSNVQGTSKPGGGDAVGGEEGPSQGSSSGEGSQGGASGQDSGEGGQGGQMEFTARRTAIFAGGRFAGILDERHSFALNVLKNNIRLAVLPCVANGVNYTVGLKNVHGGVSFKIENGIPKAIINFNAKAQVQGAKKVLNPYGVINDDVVRPEVLAGAVSEISARFNELIGIVRDTGCDMLGIRQKLHKRYYKQYAALSGSVLRDMQVEYKIKIVSAN